MVARILVFQRLARFARSPVAVSPPSANLLAELHAAHYPQTVQRLVPHKTPQNKHHLPSYPTPPITLVVGIYQQCRDQSAIVIISDEVRALDRLPTRVDEDLEEGGFEALLRGVYVVVGSCRGWGDWGGVAPDVASFSSITRISNPQSRSIPPFPSFLLQIFTAMV